MSLRNRFPLNTLIRLREHRAEAARQVLLEKQRETLRCRDACTQIEGEIEGLQRDRVHHRAQLLAPPPAGMPWPAALEQRERHIEHLAELAVAARGRLKQAQAALAQAEKAQDEARTAYFRARTRQEALEKRRDVWQREQRTLQTRREELAAEEALQGRRTSLLPH
jgi:flagellar biosynthesis chaperone FliJ